MAADGGVAAARRIGVRTVKRAFTGIREEGALSVAECGRQRVAGGSARLSGAALPLVLWLITLLVAIVGSFALTARTELLQGRMLADGSQAREVARAGIEYAMLRLTGTDPQSRWVPDGRAYDWAFSDAKVELRIVDESGKVDINQADVKLLAALLGAVGEDSLRAQKTASAIVDWRDPDGLFQTTGGAEDPDYAGAGLPYGAKDAPFQSLGELYQVMGMTPELVARLMPHLTLSSGLPQPDAEFATAPVLTAMGLDATRVRRELPPSGPVNGSGTYGIDSRATLANGREAVLHVTVRSGGAGAGSAYTVIRWETGSYAR